MSHDNAAEQPSIEWPYPDEYADRLEAGGLLRRLDAAEVARFAQGGELADDERADIVELADATEFEQRIGNFTLFFHPTHGFLGAARARFEVMQRYAAKYPDEYASLIARVEAAGFQADWRRAWPALRGDLFAAYNAMRVLVSVHDVTLQKDAAGAPDPGFLLS